MTDLLSEHSFRSYQTFLDWRRLMFFLRFAIVECEVVRQAACLEFGKLSLWPPLFDALQRLRTAVPMMHDLPVPSALTLSDWANFAILHPQEWTQWMHDFEGLAKQDAGLPGSIDPHKTVWDVDVAQDSDREDKAPFAVVLGLGLNDPTAQIQDETPVPEFPCTICDFKGKNRGGLVTHMRRKHGVQSELSIRTTSPVCPCCKVNFARRARTFSRESVPKPVCKPPWERPPPVVYLPQSVDNMQHDSSSVTE
eukprot:2723849-Amphidinium_carterae.1